MFYTPVHCTVYSYCVLYCVLVLYTVLCTRTVHSYCTLYCTLYSTVYSYSTDDNVDFYNLEAAYCDNCLWTKTNLLKVFLGDSLEFEDGVLKVQY